MVIKKRIKKIPLLFLAMGLIVLIFLRDILGIAISKIIFIVFTLGCLAVADYGTLVEMVFFLIPLFSGLPGTYIRIGLFIFLIWKRRGIDFKAFFSISIFSAMELVASLGYLNIDFIDIGSYLCTLAIFLFLIYDNKKVDYEKCLILYILGVLFCCLILIIGTLMTYQGSWIELLKLGKIRLGDHNTTSGDSMKLVLNANETAYYCITAVSASLFLSVKTNRILYKRISIVCCLILAICGLLSLSRTYFLLLLLIVMFFALSMLHDRKKRINIIIGIAATILLGMILYANNEAFHGLVEAIFSRFDDSDVATGGGRSHIFELYMEKFTSEIRFVLFGTGVTQYSEVLNLHASIHNMLQQILVCYGLFGFVLYLSILIYPVKRAYKCGAIDLLTLIPFFGVLIFAQSIQFINPYVLMLHYLVCVYAFRISIDQHVHCTVTRKE